MNKKDGPKILIIDIETSPIISYTWGLFDQNVGLNQVKQDWNIIAFAAKWLNDSKIQYADQRNEKDVHNDKTLMLKIWKLLDESDIVIGQNSKAFDIKKINARFALNGLKPPSSYRQLDTRIMAKKYFGFTSNKLEYMTDKLCTKYKKLTHKEFPGFELWRECLKGNLKAWKAMEQYNKFDVLSTEELFIKLRPWDNSINLNVYKDTNDTECSCGSTKFVKNGFNFTPSGKYQRYSCSECGSEIRSKENQLSKDKKYSLKTGTIR